MKHMILFFRLPQNRLCLLSTILFFGSILMFVFNIYRRTSTKIHTDHFPSTKGKSFEEKVKIYRDWTSKNGGQKYKFDYAKQQFLPDSIFEKYIYDLQTHLYGNPHSESPSSEYSSSVINKMRNKILKSFNTDASHYTVIFTNSLAQSLKIITETMPFSEGSNFRYTKSSTNNILGLRGIAKKRKAISSEMPVPISESSINSISTVPIPTNLSN